MAVRIFKKKKAEGILGKKYNYLEGNRIWGSH